MDNRNNFIFPDENVPETEKAKKSYGLDIATAIWGNDRTNYQGMFFNNSGRYKEYIDYANGDQYYEQYSPKAGTTPASAQSSTTGIRKYIKNYATKKVNVMVSRILKRQMDPVASAIDELSLDSKEDFKSNLEMFSNYGDLLGELGITGDLPQELMPMDATDREVYMDNNFKLNHEIWIEMGVQHYMRENSYENSVRAKAAWDSVVLGVSCEWTGMKAGKITTEWKDPAKMLLPWSDDQDFNRIKWAAHYDYYTLNEFKQLHLGELTPEQEEEALVSSRQTGPRFGSPTLAGGVWQNDTDRYAVMHFEYLTINEHVMFKVLDVASQERSKIKKYSYYRGRDKEFKKKYGASRSIERSPYLMVYTGYWVLGTNTIFGYGPKEYNTGQIGYKIDAPNMRNGKVVSQVQQMVPSLDNLVTYDRKVQSLVAKAVPKGATLDLAKLRNVNIKMGGKKMSVLDLYHLWRDEGVLITDTSESYINGDTRKAIEENENGLANDIVHYMNLMDRELVAIDEITGVSPISQGAQPHPRQGKAVTEIALASTDDSLDHLYRSSQRVTQKTYQETGAMFQTDVVYGAGKTDYVKVFGKAAVKQMKKTFAKSLYAIEVEARPTVQEWNDFYLELEKLTAAGKLEPEDRISLRRMNNLKQAESLMKVLTKRRKREAREDVQLNAQMNAQAQQQSNQAANQQSIALENIKGEWSMREKKADMEMEILKHRNDMALVGHKAGKEGDEKLDQIELKGEVDAENAKLSTGQTAQ